MKIEYRQFYSSNLGREMAFKVYGYGGKPVIVFPSSGGRFYEYEDFQMIDAVKDFINTENLFSIQSIALTMRAGCPRISGPAIKRECTMFSIAISLMNLFPL